MPIDQLKRREFVTLIGGVAAWPITARAQQPERVRRIGVLINFRPDDPEGQARLTAFRQTLRELGWINGDNVRMDVGTMPNSIADTQRNWWRWRRMPSLRAPARNWTARGAS